MNRILRMFKHFDKSALTDAALILLIAIIIIMYKMNNS